MHKIPWLTLAVVVVALAAVGFTEWRLWQGVDLLDESYYVAVPYRFSLGAQPFLDETGVLQVPTFLTYPLIKPFVAAQGGRANGIMMYTRHLYFVFVLCVAAAVFFALRRLVRWQFALLVAALYVSFVLFELTQLSYNTMGAGFLALGVALGIQALVGSGAELLPAGDDRRQLVRLALAGLAHGLAGFAFPTLWVMVPVFAACLWLSVRMAAGGEDRPEKASRRPAVLSVAAYCGAAALVLAVEVSLVLSYGWSNVERSLSLSLQGARGLGQVGGWPKLVRVLEGFWRLLWSRPYFLVGALVLYLIYRRWPRLGRALLLALPPALFLGGERDLLKAAGFVIVVALITPWLSLFLPRARRRVATALLLWAVVPAILAGVLTGWTSAEGYPHAAIGMMPALMAAGVFVVWVFEGTWSGRPASASASRSSGMSAALTCLALAALVGITIVYQFQYIARFVPYSQLTVWMDSGPYWGIHTTAVRKAYLGQLTADLAAQTTPSDRLLVYQQFPGAYLLWPYRVATNSVWISNGDDSAPLPPSTIDWLRSHHVVPDVVLRTAHPGSLTDAQYLKLHGEGLGYRVALRRPEYVILRRPPGYQPSGLR